MSTPPGSAAPSPSCRSPSRIAPARFVHEGELDVASVLIDEADALTRSTGGAPLMYAKIVLTAWRGEKTTALALIDAGARGRDQSR